MRPSKIVDDTRSTIEETITGVVSIFFIIGVLTQNLQIFRGISEYQPLIYTSVVIYFAFRFLLNKPIISTGVLRYIGLVGAVLVLFFVIGLLKAESNPLMDLIRVAAFFLVCAATLIYIQYTSIMAIRALTAIHFLFLCLAIIAPELATSISAVFTERGEFYHLGWNAYFYSEPSYAALVFLFLAFLGALRGRLQLIDAFFLCVLLVSTFSVTGVVGALVIGMSLVFSGRAGYWVLPMLLLMAYPAFVLLRALNTPAIERLDSLYNAIPSFGVYDFMTLVQALNLIEPSGMWRLLTNLFAISCITDIPWGQWSLDIGQPLSTGQCSMILGSILQESQLYPLIGQTFSAQSVFANLVIYSGLLGAVIGVILVYVQGRCIFHKRIVHVWPLSLFFLASFVIWQSAWASPTASLLLAVAAQQRLRRPVEEAGRDNPG